MKLGRAPGNHHHFQGLLSNHSPQHDPRAHGLHGSHAFLLKNAGLPPMPSHSIVGPLRRILCPNDGLDMGHDVFKGIARTTVRDSGLSRRWKMILYPPLRQCSGRSCRRPSCSSLRSTAPIFPGRCYRRARPRPPPLGSSFRRRSPPSRRTRAGSSHQQPVGARRSCHPQTSLGARSAEGAPDRDCAAAGQRALPGSTQMRAISSVRAGHSLGCDSAPRWPAAGPSPRGRFHAVPNPASGLCRARNPARTRPL